jgi:hypothetical protein
LLILSYVKFLFHFTLIICENTQIAWLWVTKKLLMLLIRVIFICTNKS